MAEYILANVDFDKNKSKRPQRLNVQLSALAFLMGRTSDIALIDFVPCEDYLRQIEKGAFPVQSFCLKQNLPEGSVINPWKIDTELEAFARKTSSLIKFGPLSPLHKRLDSKATALSLCPLYLITH